MNALLRVLASIPHIWLFCSLPFGTRQKEVPMQATYGISFERSQISEMLQDFHLLTGIPVAFVMHDQRFAIFVSDYVNPFCLRLRMPIAYQKVDSTKKAFSVSGL